MNHKARMTPQEAGRKGGLSRSAAKLAAARRNGFQRATPAPEQPEVVDGCPAASTTPKPGGVLLVTERA